MGRKGGQGEGVGGGGPCVSGGVSVSPDVLLAGDVLGGGVRGGKKRRGGREPGAGRGGSVGDGELGRGVGGGGQWLVLREFEDGGGCPPLQGGGGGGDGKGVVEGLGGAGALWCRFQSEFDSQVLHVSRLVQDCGGEGGGLRDGQCHRAWEGGWTCEAPFMDSPGVVRVEIIERGEGGKRGGLVVWEGALVMYVWGGMAQRQPRSHILKSMLYGGFVQ
jgi:hypothetical protein